MPLIDIYNCIFTPDNCYADGSLPVSRIQGLDKETMKDWLHYLSGAVWVNKDIERHRAQGTRPSFDDLEHYKAFFDGNVLTMNLLIQPWQFDQWNSCINSDEPKSHTVRRALRYPGGKPTRVSVTLTKLLDQNYTIEFEVQAEDGFGNYEPPIAQATFTKFTTEKPYWLCDGEHYIRVMLTVPVTNYVEIKVSPEQLEELRKEKPIFKHEDENFTIDFDKVNIPGEDSGVLVFQGVKNTLLTSVDEGDKIILYFARKYAAEGLNHKFVVTV